MKAAPYFAHALFSSPEAVLALPDPGDAIPYVKAMWHYARGVAYAAQRNFAAATAEASAIEAIERTAISRCSRTRAFPGSEVLSSRAQWSRPVSPRRRATAAAIERFEQAAALQDALPYTEPPYWYYPVRQSLAVALMQAGRLDAAEEQFRRALARAPNNGWSYYGLSSSTRRAATATVCAARKPSLAKTWVGDRALATDVRRA